MRTRGHGVTLMERIHHRHATSRDDLEEGDVGLAIREDRIHLAAPDREAYPYAKGGRRLGRDAVHARSSCTTGQGSGGDDEGDQASAHWCPPSKSRCGAELYTKLVPFGRCARAWSTSALALPFPDAADERVLCLLALLAPDNE